MTIMKDLLRVRQKAGEVGIEIELEGDNLPTEAFGSWRAERDGSLRGHSVELVLQSPCARKDVGVRLKEVTSALKYAEVLDTGRAGVHVHINIQKLSEVQLVNFITLYLIYENLLVAWCGEKRVGNLFCLRTEDASGYLELLRHAISEREWRSLDTDDVRYASMNLKALCTYGSLEFRAMRSTVDMRLLEQWVSLLLALKDSAHRYDDPIQIIEEFSVLGAEEAFKKVFGKHHLLLDFDPIALMSGVRTAQHIAYCRVDWEERQPEAVVRQPIIEANEEPLDEVMDAEAAKGNVYFEREGKHYYRVVKEGDQRRWIEANDILEVFMNPEVDQRDREYLRGHYLDHVCRMVGVDYDVFVDDWGVE